MKNLKDILIEYGVPNEADMIEESFDTKGYTYKQLKETLFKVGTILLEDEDRKILVVTIRVGYNHATIAIQIKNAKINLVAYAKEGIVKQNTAKKAVDKITCNFISSNKAIAEQKSTVSKYKFIFIGIVCLILMFIIATSFIAKNAIKKYNVAANEFNSIVDAYNKAAAVTSVDNIDGVPAKVEKINIENDSIFEGLVVFFGKNSITKINQDTETIYDLVEQLNVSLRIINQITAPSGDWVESRLKSVKGITGTQAVTEENNPDGLLGKKGGYKNCIYFTFEKIAPDSVPGETIVDKGTDAGGSVEIYTTLAEAEARCEYLEGFNGTIFYSGSYAIVGTNVIRTSYSLSNEEQFELTDLITQALTKQ